MSSFSLWRAAATLVVLALLGGCAGEPRSAFQPSEPFGNPLLQPGLRGGLNVPPVAGLPEAAGNSGTELAAAVAEAMRKAEIIAVEAAPAAGRYALVGAFEPGAASPGRIAIAWRLIDDEGREARRFVTEGAPDPAGRWMAAMADEAVSMVNRHIVESEGLPPAPSEMPTLTIVGVEGAPGAGGRALTSALEYHLKQAGLTLSDTPTADGLRVSGKVSVIPSKVPGAADLLDNLTVAWTVRRADGGELGQIEQANDVPKGLLNGPWGDLAFVIAEGAAEGISDLLLRTAGRKQGGAASATIQPPK